MFDESERERERASERERERERERKCEHARARERERELAIRTKRERNAIFGSQLIGWRKSFGPDIRYRVYAPSEWFAVKSSFRRPCSSLSCCWSTTRANGVNLFFFNTMISMIFSNPISNQISRGWSNVVFVFLFFLFSFPPSLPFPPSPPFFRFDERALVATQKEKTWYTARTTSV